MQFQLRNTILFFRTQESFREHNNLFENKIRFDGTEQSFAEQNSLFDDKTQFDRSTIFSRTRLNLIEHKRKLIHNKIN